MSLSPDLATAVWVGDSGHDRKVRGTGQGTSPLPFGSSQKMVVTFHKERMAADGPARRLGGQGNWLQQPGTHGKLDRQNPFTSCPLTRVRHAHPYMYTHTRTHNSSSSHRKMTLHKEVYQCIICALKDQISQTS